MNFFLVGTSPECLLPSRETAETQQTAGRRWGGRRAVRAGRTATPLSTTTTTYVSVRNVRTYSVDTFVSPCYMALSGGNRERA